MKKVAFGLVLLVAVGGSISFYIFWEDIFLTEEEKQARSLFMPVLEKLDDAIDEDSQNDIDKSIRVVFELEKAVFEGVSIEQYIRLMTDLDYQHVAPDILKAQREVVGTMMKLYSLDAKQWSIDQTIFKSDFNGNLMYRL